MCEGASLAELEDAAHPMSFPPQLILHWKVRAQELSRMHFHMAFPSAPCQNKSWEKGGVVLSITQLTTLPKGVVVLFRCVLQCLRS